MEGKGGGEDHDDKKGKKNVLSPSASLTGQVDHELARVLRRAHDRDGVRFQQRRRDNQLFVAHELGAAPKEVREEAAHERLEAAARVGRDGGPALGRAVVQVVHGSLRRKGRGDGGRGGHAWGGRRAGADPTPPRPPSPRLRTRSMSSVCHAKMERHMPK